jgi:hypothetical protein
MSDQPDVGDSFHLAQEEHGGHEQTCADANGQIENDRERKHRQHDGEVAARSA